MRYFYWSIALTTLAIAIFYLCSQLFFTNTATPYNFSFLFGLFLGGFIFSIGLYSLAIEYDAINEQAEDCIDAKSELAKVKNSNETLQRKLNEASRQLDTFREFQVSFDRFETAIKNFIQEQHQLQNESITSTLKNLPVAQSSENFTELIKRQQAALVSFRQERAALKEFTSTVPVGESTLWEVLNNKMTQATRKVSADESASATSEQKQKKTFVPSPPTRGKRARKYMRL